MNRASVLVVVLMALGLAAACSADRDSGGVADAEPITTAPTTSSPTTNAPEAATPDAPDTSVPTSSPVTLVVAATDEVYLDTSSGQLIHRDGNGAYICVLRRSDDLADLRAGFSGSDDPPAEEAS